MGQISLEGMKFFAYHGVYEEERILGNHYTVDIFIETDISSAAMTDNVFETINYETVYLVVQSVMKKPVQLIETLIEKIIHALKHQFATIHQVKIRIEKANPIPGAKLSHSAVETEETFVNSCPRCGRPFICYEDDTCWCQDVKVHPQTQAALRQEFRGCLCQNCLEFYAG